MLSDEEREAIEQLRSWREYIIKHKEDVNKANDIEFYLRTAINLIEKQSKEIEELKETLKCTQNSWYEDAKIVDKIKAKIETKLKELDEQINEEWKKYGNSKELQDMEDMYNFLQSLLEKEGE